MSNASIDHRPPSCETLDRFYREGWTPRHGVAARPLRRSDLSPSGLCSIRWNGSTSSSSSTAIRRASTSRWSAPGGRAAGFVGRCPSCHALDPVHDPGNGSRRRRARRPSILRLPENWHDRGPVRVIGGCGHGDESAAIERGIFRTAASSRFASAPRIHGRRMTAATSSVEAEERSRAIGTNWRRRVLKLTRVPDDPSWPGRGVTCAGSVTVDRPSTSPDRSAGSVGERRVFALCGARRWLRPKSRSGDRLPRGPEGRCAGGCRLEPGSRRSSRRRARR